MSKQRKEDISVLSPLKLQGIRKTEIKREKRESAGEMFSLYLTLLKQHIDKE